MVAACRSRTASEGKACPQLQVMWAWPGIMPRGRGEGVGRRAPIRGGERGPSLPIGLVGPGNEQRRVSGVSGNWDTGFCKWETNWQKLERD